MKLLTKPASFILTLCFFMILCSCSKNTDQNKKMDNMRVKNILPSNLNFYWDYDAYSIDNMGKVSLRNQMGGSVFHIPAGC